LITVRKHEPSSRNLDSCSSNRQEGTSIYFGDKTAINSWDG